MASSLYANHVSSKADNQRSVSLSFFPFSYTNADRCRLQCAWTKNPVRKPRTEQHFEAMHKHNANLGASLREFCKYANYLESLLDNCQQTYHPNSCVDFRVHRPTDPEGLLNSSTDLDLDLSFMNGDDNDANSDSDPTKEICLPTQTLKVCILALIYHSRADGSYLVGRSRKAA